MIAFQLDGTLIINILEVESLDVIPNLVLAISGGKIGNHIVGGVIVPPTGAEITAAKIARKEHIYNRKVAANKTNFSHAGKMVLRGDPEKDDLDSTALYIALNNVFHPSFPNQWKATDGTWINIPNIPAFKALYNSMVDQGMTNYAKSETLGAQIDAATTIEAINAIDW